MATCWPRVLNYFSFATQLSDGARSTKGVQCAVWAVVSFPLAKVGLFCFTHGLLFVARLLSTIGCGLSDLLVLFCFVQVVTQAASLFCCSLFCDLPRRISCLWIQRFETRDARSSSMFVLRRHLSWFVSLKHSFQCPHAPNTYRRNFYSRHPHLSTFLGV